MVYKKTFLNSYYLNTDSPSKKFQLNLDKNNSSDHSITDILKHGLQCDHTGNPLYPTIKHIGLIAVSLQAEHIPLLLALVKERNVKSLTLHAIPLASETISALLKGLQGATHLKSLCLSYIGVETTLHKDLVNQLIKFNVSLSKIDINEYSFDNEMIDNELLKINQAYQKAKLHISSIKHLTDPHLIPFLEKAAHTAFDTYKAYFEPVSNENHYQVFYNLLLINLSFHIGNKYQDFALPEKANDYFGRVIKHPDSDTQMKHQAQTIYTLNQYAFGCQMMVDNDHESSIKSLEQVLNTADKMKDNILFNMAKKSHTIAQDNIKMKEATRISPKKL